MPSRKGDPLSESTRAGRSDETRETDATDHAIDNSAYEQPGLELPPGFDGKRIEAAMREVLIGIGEDPDREGLVETPARIARAYGEIFSGLGKEPDKVLARTFNISHDEMVLVRDIDVHSMCEHHLLPFHGRAHVCYIPAKDGQCPGRPARRARRARGAGVRAPVHDDARGAQARQHHRHQRRAWRAA